MTQATDRIPLFIPQQFMRGAHIEVPYPEGRDGRSYQANCAQLSIPGSGRFLVENNDTFRVYSTERGVSVLYMSDQPIPGGTRCELLLRLVPQKELSMLEGGIVVAGFTGTLAAVSAVIAIETPYKAGGYYGPNPLSPLSMARWVDTTGGKGEMAFGVDRSLLMLAAGATIQEVRDKALVPAPQPGMSAAIGATSAATNRALLVPKQEMRDLSKYDPGRLQAEIAELADRYRDHGYNPNPKPEERAGLPMQEIRDSQGNILMRGRAESVEHLIAIEMDKAEKSNDPGKKVLNLADAQLDERTLGRKLNLEGFNFKHADMRGANLAGAVIKDCKFENCDMEGINLKKAHVSLSSFENVNMNSFTGDKDTKFDTCTMKNVHMANAFAPEMKFENIRAEKLNIEGAHFAGSSWTHVHIDNLWGKDANMNGAKLGDFHVKGRESNLDGIKLNGATVHNASFGTAEYGIPMRGMQAQNSSWSDVQFNKSDLSGADFTKANFTRVDMRQVVTPLRPMNMQEANLSGLKAGDEARFTAYKAVHSGITMMPHENFVFNGTGPIERAAQAAINANTTTANITAADGSTQEEYAQKSMNVRLQQQQMMLKRQQNMNAPAPTFGKKKGT